MNQDQKILQKDICQLSMLVSDIYNAMVVLHYFCENQSEIEELSNILSIVTNLRRDADTINAFFINFETEIIPILKDDFFFIELTVNQDQTAKIIVQRDKGEPILYEKDLDYTDCPYSDKPYKFCLDVNSETTILCLLSEY